MDDLSEHFFTICYEMAQRWFDCKAKLWTAAIYTKFQKLPPIFQGKD